MFSQSVCFIPCYYCCRLFLPLKMTSTLCVSYQENVKYVSISKIVSTLKSSGRNLQGNSRKSVWNSFFAEASVWRHLLERTSVFGMVHGAASQSWKGRRVAHYGPYTCSVAWRLSRRCRSVVYSFTLIWLPRASFFLNGWNKSSRLLQNYKRTLHLEALLFSKSTLYSK